MVGWYDLGLGVCKQGWMNYIRRLQNILILAHPNIFLEVSPSPKSILLLGTMVVILSTYLVIQSDEYERARIQFRKGSKTVKLNPLLVAMEPDLTKCRSVNLNGNYADLDTAQFWSEKDYMMSKSIVCTLCLTQLRGEASSGAFLSHCLLSSYHKLCIYFQMKYLICIGNKRWMKVKWRAMLN